jgi:hypothetical protein
MYKLNDVLSAFQDFSNKGKFLYHQSSTLSEVCNIPAINDYSGIYLFYDNATDELLYIGISGREASEGEIQHRKDGLRGRVLKGKQFGDFRRNTLSAKMKEENIKTLRIEWFVTYGHSEKQIPRKWEILLLNLYQKEFNRLPRWNKEI